MVQGSGIKGALREQLKTPLGSTDLYLTLFGHEPPSAGGGTSKDESQAAEQEMFAGALSVTDARLLLLPVRTVVGGWAWVTCPMVVERWLRDLDTVGLAGPTWENDPAWLVSPPAEGTAFVGKRPTVVADGALLIEDLEFVANLDASVDAFADWLAERAFPGGKVYATFCNRLPGQLAILGDTDFRFLTEHATEVVTRIKIGEQGTVAKGALWTEEALPAETLLYSMALFSKGRRPKIKKGSAKGESSPQSEESARKDYEADELREALNKVVGAVTRIQLGGDRTTGRGLVALRSTKGGA